MPQHSYFALLSTNGVFRAEWKTYLDIHGFDSWYRKGDEKGHKNKELTWKQVIAICIFFLNLHDVDGLRIL